MPDNTEEKDAAEHSLLRPLRVLPARTGSRRICSMAGRTHRRYTAQQPRADTRSDARIDGEEGQHMACGAEVMRGDEARR